MKYKLFTACFIFGFFIFGFNVFKKNNPEIPQSEIIVNQLLTQISVDLEKTHQMKTVATDVSMPRGVIKILGLDFRIQGPITKQEIRKILIDSAQKFVFMVNKYDSVHRYLEIDPFEIKNVSINLFIIDKSGFNVDDPYIGIAGISKGILDYETLILDGDIPVNKSRSEESYLDALKALGTRT